MPYVPKWHSLTNALTETDVDSAMIPQIPTRISTTHSLPTNNLIKDNNLPKTNNKLTKAKLIKIKQTTKD